MPLILAVDVGNTNITLGLVDVARSFPRVKTLWRQSTRPESMADEWGILWEALIRREGLDPAVLEGVAAASVVPALDDVLRETAGKYFGRKALMIDGQTPTGVRNRYQRPEEVGADRLVNAAAAHARVKGPCIVVDFGTATTFDCVNAKGDYLGGVITPGPRMAAESLARGTAKLPLPGLFRKPTRLIGRRTTESLSSGLYFGYLDLVRGLLKRLSQDMGASTRVISTGGLAGLFADDLPKVTQVPHLTLEGIGLVWNVNRKKVIHTLSTTGR